MLARTFLTGSIGTSRVMLMVFSGLGASAFDAYDNPVPYPGHEPGAARVRRLR